MAHLRVNLEFEGQCGNSLSIRHGEAYTTPWQPGLACVRAARAHSQGCSSLSSEGQEETEVQTDRVHRWQAEPSNSTEDLEMLERKLDES